MTHRYMLSIFISSNSIGKKLHDMKSLMSAIQIPRPRLYLGHKATVAVGDDAKQLF